MGSDPARNPDTDKGNTRMELPPDAYLLGENKDIFALRNNRFNSEGGKALVSVNQFRMTGFDFNKKVYQYDVSALPQVFDLEYRF